MQFFASDLNTTFRAEVADRLEGLSSQQPDSENLWKEAEIYGYMSEAVDQWAKRTGAIYKTFDLPLTIGTQVVPISKSILDIRSARLVTADKPIRPANTSGIGVTINDDYGWTNWRSMFNQGPGVPQFYVRDYERSALLLVPPPNAVDTLEIQCTVTLSVPMCSGMPLPYSDYEDQRIVLHYMKYLAYAKQDADTLDLQRSGTFQQQFEAMATDRGAKLARYRHVSGPARMEW